MGDDLEVLGGHVVQGLRVVLEGPALRQALEAACRAGVTQALLGHVGQLALARELSLPVIIHDRDAHADTMAIVREFPGLRGVFHCFAGSVEMARELVDMGWYLSFNGAATFKNARKAPEVIRAVPMERLMIETDAPYLTPVPYRGRRNDSTYVHLVAEKIAQLRDMTPAAAEQATWENGKRFFGI